MARLPKDYSRHENKFLFGMSLKNLAILFMCGTLELTILKADIYLVLKILSAIPVAMISLFFIFYRTEEGDDFATYLISLTLYYLSPKCLVFKKRYMTDDEIFEAKEASKKKSNTNKAKKGA